MMTTKQLFRQTATLLRTALLLGAMILVNTQYTQAQTAEQRAAMPDAFETMNPADIIGDGKYYYIQFYNYANNVCSYLTDCGANLKAKAKDFLPYTNNRLWTLEATGTTGQFRLKSKEGRYLGYISGVDGLSSNQYRFGCTNVVENAAIMTYTKVGDDYFLLMAGETDILYRVGNNEWATDLAKTGNNSGTRPYASLRFAKLKSNAAFIIYYREEGTENTNPNVETTRHYLTYSGADYGVESLIDNGSFEGGDASSFRSPNSSTTSPITNGIGKDGSRGVKIESLGNEANDYETQFVIYAKSIVPIGTKVLVEFDYRADQNVNGVLSQAHAQPGQYKHWDAIGSINFTTNWQHFSKEITVSSDMGGGDNNFQSIAINLGKKANTTYYFDNVVFTIPENTDVSSRQSVYSGSEPLCKLLTQAAYHQDGLWSLEGTGSDGEFYIKKYGSSQYLNPVKKNDAVSPPLFYCVLGNKDESLGKFVLVESLNNRYTRIKNNTTAWGYTRYLSCSQGDGWPAMQVSESNTDPNFWYAGFYPVEVPDPNKDNDYQVLLRVKRPSNRIKLTGATNNPTITPLDGSTMDNLYGATFTPTADLTNIFQIKNMPTGCYEKIVIKFGSAVPAGWYIHAYGDQGSYSSLEGKTEHEITLDPSKTIDDFTIFNWFDVREPITITECYFTPASPTCDLNEMLNHEGGTDAYSEDPSLRKLWHLEQIGDYAHFRLKSPDGQYFQADGKMTGDENSAKIFTNAELLDRFDLKWFYVDPAVKEIPVNFKVTHRESYLKQYAEKYKTLALDKQGLATDAQSDWWNYEKGTQKVNHFEITHYVKRGNTKTVEFPTILNNSSDHIYYQRWYHYNDETCDNAMYPDGSDINGLKNHVSLDVSGNVQYFLYNNGIVTGEKLAWDGIEEGSYVRHANRNFKFTNSDGRNFTVAADVSRYSDLTYKNTSSPLNGDLEEPSLTMRYIYYMKDAKEMAKNLTSKTYIANCTDADKWLEAKTFHFPAKQIHYENLKKSGYRGEFIGLRHVFSDYWVFNDGNAASDSDDNLLSAVNADNRSGKIEVQIYDPYSTGIKLGGYNTKEGWDRNAFSDGDDDGYQGFYFYDMMDDNKLSYGDSRFIVFRYPSDTKEAKATGADHPVYINVYFNTGTTKYQLAQFTIIFDSGTVTLPYTSVNGSNYVKDDGTSHDYVARDPKNLVGQAGKPIAKITFDYPYPEDKPDIHTYHYPDKGETRHSQTACAPGGIIPNSSPVPLTFDKTNYAFDGDGCNWGSYAMVGSTYTQFGNGKSAMPANDDTYGYGAGVKALQADAGLRKAFLYIDASEQPGDICSAPFVGDFCSGDKLMFSGWISGSNKAEAGYSRCPGGVTLTVKGEHTVNGELKTETLYRFCPGQIYELDNGEGSDGSTNGNNVVWQQFYFEFVVSEKYDRHWIEVNNNCVSSRGGDFMLDNIEVYAIVPEVKPEMNTPLCVNKDGTADMRLLKLTVDFNKEKSSANVSGADAWMGFVFLKKDVFLKKFLANLKNLTESQKSSLGLAGKDFTNYSLDDLAYDIEEGVYGQVVGNSDLYKTAFNEALLGSPKMWKSTEPSTNMGAGVMFFQWKSNYESNELYSFAKAVNKTHAVYRETDAEGEKYLVFNGNYPELPWEINKDYYIVPSNDYLDNIANLHSVFNICSQCSKASVFHLDPPYTILGMEASDETQEYEVCEGKIPTVLTDLKGYNLNGDVVPLKNINFDWWLGDMSDPSNPVLATLENYHSQTNSAGTVRLDAALSTLRAYYPDATSIDGLAENISKTPNLTTDMVTYLQELVEKGQLILHQRSVNIPAQKVSADDPYCYFVACPIHDGYFDEALNNGGANNVAYFCDEPQGLALKIGEKAPTLKTGFVPNENGFAEYNYPDGNPVLSIRLAKKEQFETVQHGTTTDAAIANPAAYDASKHFLWLPIRNAEVQSTGSTGVIQKSDDYNVYLASTDDPTWDKEISRSMRQTVSSLPIVGKIVSLTAVNTKGQTNVDQTGNRLCIYFTDNFEVREGYSYTLSLPFKESPGENACDGTILINLKIVPDYEVWTGGADNTDWNNDQNWRRADGNTNTSISEPASQSPLNNNELYVTTSLPSTSGLKDYTTNFANYRTPLDRILRKGFAPLYCTHILIKSNEWGNAPVLYDALDAKSGNANLTASPFPNLRDTSTPILKFDMQARLYDIWQETYGSPSNKGRAGDLIAEMYQINSCDEIAFQPGAELLNAHLLNYNNAWVEYELNNNRWYLLGSPLQGTISGEWYAPTGTAQQKTTYYENVTFGAGYDRYSPAIYQRSWDKAKAVLYEVGSAYSTGDNPNDEDLGNSNTMPGSAQQGQWSGTTWDTTGADEYLDRLGYKPLGGNKVNVAIKGVWSNTYNDATVDYTKGGFSVLVKNDLKGNDTSGGKSIIRLPKEDTMYDYYKFEETGANDGGTDTNLSDVRTLNRAKNRGRLKTDLLLPASAQKTESAASRYGDQRTYTRVPTQLNADTGLPIDGKLQSITETVAAGISNMGYYLVENPFPCGLDMGKFFAANTGLQKKYWLLTTAESGQSPRQQLVQQAPDGDDGEWVTADGNGFAAASAIVAPGQGFFVQATTPGESTAITFNKDMQAKTRYGAKTGTRTFSIVVGTKQKMTTKEETITLEDGTTKTVTIEVPVTDDSGKYVVEDITDDVKVSTYVQSTDDEEFPLKTRGESAEPILSGLVITAERGGMQSSALVLQRGEASNDFLPEEDTEVFLNSDLVNAPTVYTLCGRLATTINTIHDFRCLPLGVESSSDVPCTLTFQGVETLGDSIAFYDAVEQKLTPLESGMTVKVSGQTQNRYFLLGGISTAIEAAEATHLQIFTQGKQVTVIASTTEPITNVRCYDTAGRLVYSAVPDTVEHNFTLPVKGVYIIEAQTHSDRKNMKVILR